MADIRLTFRYCFYEEEKERKYGTYMITVGIIAAKPASHSTPPEPMIMEVKNIEPEKILTDAEQEELRDALVSGSISQYDFV